MNAPEREIKRHPSAAWQDIEGRVLVVTPKTKKVHIIDGCGVSVWRQLAQPRTVDSLVQEVCAEYEVNAGQAQKDIERLMTELKEKDIVCYIDGD